MERQGIANYGDLILRTRHRATKGQLGEYLVMAILNQQGYIARKPDAKCQGDILVADQTTGETIRVEVKTATRNTQGKYTFGLRKKDKYGGTDCNHADVVVLVAVSTSGAVSFFVVPASELPGKSVSIKGNPHDYRGKLNRYRQYHSTLEIRTNVNILSDRVAILRHPVYAEGAVRQ